MNSCKYSRKKKLFFIITYIIIPQLIAYILDISKIIIFNYLDDNCFINYGEPYISECKDLTFAIWSVLFIFIFFPKNFFSYILKIYSFFSMDYDECTARRLKKCFIPYAFLSLLILFFNMIIVPRKTTTLLRLAMITAIEHLIF